MIEFGAAIFPLILRKENRAVSSLPLPAEIP
jgi:hypothetical protein